MTSSKGAIRKASPRRSAQETREHVVAIAGELFYYDGIRATGVDSVAAQAGVAPVTLYRLFASKDDLVAAYVEHCSERYKSCLRAAAARETGTPLERILATFDAFATEIQSEGCRGCPFLMVLAEYPDPQSAPHAYAVAHKAWLRGLFHELARDLAAEGRVRDPEALGERLALVAEGMYASAQALGSTGPAAHGRSVAEALITGELDRAPGGPCPPAS